MITDINQLDFSKQYTYADYLTWKFKERVEIIRGWIMKMAAPSPTHQLISKRLMFRMEQHLRNGPCQTFYAPMDVRLPDYRYPTDTGDQQILDTVQPDLFVVCDAGKIDQKGCIGAPDWIIEILSPGNSKKEMRHKFQLYESAGVREYWIVDPEHCCVQVFDLHDEGYHLRRIFVHDDRVASALFPELIIDLREVFPEVQDSGESAVAEAALAYGL